MPRDRTLTDLNRNMGAMRGVQIAFNAVPLLSPMTGVGQYTYRLITEMQRLLAIKPWLFYGTSWQQDIRLSAGTAVKGMHTVFKRMSPHSPRVIRWLKQARFSAGASARGIRLYHEPAYLAYRFRGPTVVTVHDISWIRHPETHPTDRVREMNRIMPRVVDQAAHIVVDSEFVRQEVMDYYNVAPERVTTVLLGVGQEFRPLPFQESAPLLERLGVQRGRYMLAVGTLEPRKNLATVIAAYAQLPESLRRHCPLLIAGMAGWGAQGATETLRRLMEKGQVRLLGYVPQVDLPALYSGSRMLVYPSLYEGFGLPPLEAMACGVPVIASRRASLPEVVGDTGFLVDPLDEGALSARMRELFDDDGLCTSMGEAGRRRAAEFTWRKFATEMLNVYRRVVD